MFPDKKTWRNFRAMQDKCFAFVPRNRVSATSLLTRRNETDKIHLGKSYRRITNTTPIHTNLAYPT